MTPRIIPERAGIPDEQSLRGGFHGPFRGKSPRGNQREPAEAWERGREKTVVSDSFPVPVDRQNNDIVEPGIHHVCAHAEVS